MTREAFRELVKKGPVLLDGATGTNLQKAGMPVGVCPEQWILENSEVLIDLQKRYVEAGTDILFAPTFTASRIKLKEYGLEDHLEEMNRKLVALSKEAAKGTNALVAGDLTMTGEQLYPLGDLMFEDLVDVYKEQAKIIAEAGADLFVVETMMSLQECRAAVLAIREVCDLPVMVSLTYNEDGRTLYGTDPVTAVVVMQSLGADAVGMNCSTGPEAMLEPIAKMAEYATIPLLAKPNAGMPELIDGQTVFNVEPEEFAEVGKKLVEEGAAIIGGCCGTTPEHIRALKEAVKGIPVKAPLQTKRRMLTSERKSVEITLDGRFMVIGERINPTGKKKLQAELKEGSLNLVRTMALEQEENGASILDINMGMNGIDEKEMMLRTIYEVTSTLDDDCALLEACGAAFVFAPSVAEMYPEPDTRQFSYAPLDTVMEGAFRPGHFNGVCQIVSKLFDAVKPDRAYFGEKDFQQLAIIREMVRQMNYSLEIVGCPIIREEDGLALSSRNARLSVEERKNALKISQTLFESRTFAASHTVAETQKFVEDAIAAAPGLRLEYFELVDGNTLQKIANWEDTAYAVGCITVFCGEVRLIDNIKYKE